MLAFSPGSAPYQLYLGAGLIGKQDEPQLSHRVVIQQYQTKKGGRVMRG